MLPYRPDIARNVLLLLATMQGAQERPERDEEPGKILHEFRSGEMALSGELPFAPYYGSIDSTPSSWCWLTHYLRWTGDIEFIRTLTPNFKAALDWMDNYGDPNGRGWLAYSGPIAGWSTRDGRTPGTPPSTPTVRC